MISLTLELNLSTCEILEGRWQLRCMDLGLSGEIWIKDINFRVVGYMRRQDHLGGEQSSLAGVFIRSTVFIRID